MSTAGYPNSSGVPFAIRLGPASLAFSQPWGAWGYLGAAEAQQYGFRVPPGSALSALGTDTSGAGADPATLPQAEQAAIGKCATIVTGIYFAVLASYEQQIVNANAAALADAVRQFRAAFGAELRKLPGC